MTAPKVGLQSVGVLTIGALTLGTSDAAATGAGTAVVETNASYVDVTAATSRITIAATGIYLIHAYASADSVEGLYFTLWKNGSSSEVVFSKKKNTDVAGYPTAASRSFVLSLTATDYLQLGGKCAVGTPSMTGAIHAVYLGPAS